MSHQDPSPSEASPAETPESASGEGPGIPTSAGPRTSGLPLDEWNLTEWTWRSWLAPAAVLGALLVLSPLVGVRFLGDDFIWVYEASRQTLAGLFQRGYFEFVRPVNEAWWYLMWWVSGTDPRGYHLLTLGVFALTALLLYQWVRELTGRPWAGFMALCLFLADPLHVEPVSWPSACSEVLAGAFVLASLYAWRRWRLEGGTAWMLATLSAMLAAFGSKESSVALLPGLILVEITLVPPEEPLARRLRALATVLVPGCLVLAAAAFSVAPEAGYSTSISGKTLSVGLEYLNRALLTGEVRGALAALLPQSANLAVAIALVAALVLTWKRTPAVFLNLAWVPFTVLAYAVFVPDLPIADRYFYLASLAVAAAAGSFLASLRGPQAVVWSVLVATVVTMGTLQTTREVRFRADNYGMPQPEAESLRIALADHQPDAPVFVYCPPQVELHPLYACALLGGLDLEQIHPWPDILRYDKLPEGSAALFWDQFSTRFSDLTEAARSGLASMVGDGRAPRTGTANLQRETTELAAWPEARGWTPQALEPGEGGGWKTPGVAGRLLGPEARIPPLAISLVRVELEVLHATPGAVCGLNWRTEANPQGQSKLEVSSGLPSGPAVVNLWLTPGTRREWWDQGDILQLELILSTTPAEVKVRSISVHGHPRVRPLPEPKKPEGFPDSKPG